MDTETQLALIAQDVEHIKKDVDEIKTALKDEYVTHTEYAPVKRIVYSLVTLFMAGVVGGMIKLMFFTGGGT